MSHAKEVDTQEPLLHQNLFTTCDIPVTHSKIDHKHSSKGPYSFWGPQQRPQNYPLNKVLLLAPRTLSKKFTNNPLRFETTNGSKQRIEQAKLTHIFPRCVLSLGQPRFCLKLVHEMFGYCRSCSEVSSGSCSFLFKMIL